MAYIQMPELEGRGDLNLSTEIELFLIIWKVKSSSQLWIACGFEMTLTKDNEMSMSQILKNYFAIIHQWLILNCHPSVRGPKF